MGPGDGGLAAANPPDVTSDVAASNAARMAVFIYFLRILASVPDAMLWLSADESELAYWKERMTAKRQQ